MATIAVVISTLPSRTELLRRALTSVHRQTRQPDQVIVVVDSEHRGAAHTRNKGLAQVTTDLVAFLDDDDEFLPHHLQALSDCQAASGADLVYPWFDVVGGTDPLGAFGKPFDPVGIRSANYIPVTILAKTESVRAAGGFVNLRDYGATCEDWACWLAMLDRGAEFVHLPLVTWRWHHHAENSGGQMWREDLARAHFG